LFTLLPCAGEKAYLDKVTLLHYSGAEAVISVAGGFGF
jgi:hypothetical protein